MAKRNGNGGVADVTVGILREIRDEIRTMRDRLETRVGELHEDMEQLKGRFDNFLFIAGDRYQEHERRIRALEDRLPQR